MKLILAAILLAGIAGSALAQEEHYVRGYTRADGTYVAPHYQTNPNGTRDDNWSTRGNVNPYTGQPGTKPRDEDLGGRLYYSAPSAPYGSSFGATAPDSSFGEPTQGSSFGEPPPPPYSPY